MIATIDFDYTVSVQPINQSIKILNLNNQLLLMIPNDSSKYDGHVDDSSELRFQRFKQASSII